MNFWEILENWTATYIEATFMVATDALSDRAHDVVLHKLVGEGSASGMNESGSKFYATLQALVT